MARPARRGQRVALDLSPTMRAARTAREPVRDWYRVTNDVSHATASVYVYDSIGYPGVSAQDLVREIDALDVAEIHVHLNSPGGDAFDAVAIYNALLSHPANVIVHVDGLAASAASFIAQAGDTRLIARNAQMMIHDAQGVCMGAAVDMRTVADLLDKVSDNIADIYAQRGGGTAPAWRKRMQDTVWYTAAEAVAVGLADRIEDVAAGRATARNAVTARASTDLRSVLDAGLLLAEFDHAVRDARR